MRIPTVPDPTEEIRRIDMVSAANNTLLRAFILYKERIVVDFQ